MRDDGAIVENTLIPGPSPSQGEGGLSPLSTGERVRVRVCIDTKFSEI